MLPLLYHGGAMNEPGVRLWLAADADYAAGFAQIHYEGALWALTLNLADSDILDLTNHGLDACAVADALTAAGIPVSCLVGDEDRPQSVLRRVADDAIRAAGFRAIRLCECIDWGQERTDLVLRRAVSLCLVDLGVIVACAVMPMPKRNFQEP